MRDNKAADKKGRSEMEKQEVEVRALGFDLEEEDNEPMIHIERRAEAKQDALVEGSLSAMPLGSANSLTLDDFQERIDPSAFKIVTERRGRSSPLETRALFNHDPNHVLGRFPSTLTLSVDERGLKYKKLKCRRAEGISSKRSREEI